MHRACRFSAVTASERSSEARRTASAVDLARSGEREARIEVVDYDASWPTRFDEEAARLTAISPKLTFHHIGSTAVPGMSAKPIIDIMAWSQDLDSPLVALVERGGYQYPHAYNATLSGRRWLCRPSASYRTHHLHLVGDEAELIRHLRFRDALRAKAHLAAEYAALKRDLATQMPDDREGYTAGKTDFIRRVEARLAPD